MFVEKPLSTSAADGVEMVEAARQAGRVLLVGHTFVYTAAVNKIKEVIDSGELGEILYISTTRVNLGIFHTQTGSTPSWSSNPDEDRIKWYPSSDGTLLVVRTRRVGEDAGRICTLDSTDPTALVELGCHEYGGDAGAETQQEAGGHERRGPFAGRDGEHMPPRDPGARTATRAPVPRRARPPPEPGRAS